MRQLIGCLVLVAGVAGLGWFAAGNHAVRMQDALAQAARDVAAQGVETTVSGRDLTVTGTVSNETEYAVLLANFEGLDGVRTVDLSGVDTLPIASPYEATIRFGDSRTIIQGVVPSNAALMTLVENLPAATEMDMTLASGAPNGDWPLVIAGVVSGLPLMKTADVTLSDTTLTLTALAPTPTQRDAFLVILNTLPQTYDVNATIEVEDDGTPLRLSLTLQDGIVTGEGKFPRDLPIATLNELPFETDITVQQAVIPAQDSAWPDNTRTALAALAQLIDGQLSIDGNTITLDGTGTPDGIAAASDLMATLPDAAPTLALWDDGTPIQMSMDWDGAQATAIGKLPAGFNPRGPAGVAVVADVRRSFFSDDTGQFTRNANAGSAALGVLDTGLLVVTDTSVQLTGTAASPQVDVVLDSLFAGLADTTTITRDLIYLDDGSPAAWSLDYSATSGAVIKGRTPNGLAVDDIAAALGVPVEGAPVTALDDTNLGSSLDALTRAAIYLPEIESLTYTKDNTGSALDLIVAPGVDIDLVAIDLAENLPADVAFTLAPLEDLPAAGATRTNAVTGLSEIFRNGFWLPSLDFTANVAGCTQQADAILTRTKINFLSSEARLDATSIRSLNALAAVAQPCLDAGLVLEIGGHTDATGSELANEVLSFDRASAVLDALAQRGLSRAAMNAIGYGQAQPIADNSTAEGRAANRRTSLTWTDPATP